MSTCRGSVEPAHLHLKALDRRIHVPTRAPGSALLAQHMPRLDRGPQLQVHAAIGHRAEAREAELHVWSEPRGIERVAAVFAEFI